MAIKFDTVKEDDHKVLADIQTFAELQVHWEESWYCVVASLVD
jgi:hypothetical protein